MICCRASVTAAPAPAVDAHGSALQNHRSLSGALRPPRTMPALIRESAATPPARRAPPRRSAVAALFVLLLNSLRN
ncbi:hypothetical protein EVAR_280_1 [Eumeta japonica]|uniref:Uncharacterized protein n=1 Tax=Eumeta variegata TaxID=151549 RepID=A0A4C1SCA1_EUMVA|nr:hypothetical protein EVAR_280_1 [Eumeta japonica]